jgi:hypothetical protein
MAFPKFTEGSSVRPTIQHDHGFLDDGKGKIDPTKRRPATWEDYKSYAYWSVKLEGAEMLRPDLSDATRSYGHFLDASGTDLTVDYESFLQRDKSGAIVLQSVTEDVVASAIEIDDQKILSSPPAAARQDTFTMTSDAISVGGKDSRYPYPDSENWQKTIGAHYIWIEASVNASIDPVAKSRKFQIKSIIHMEDMYNFNPGAADIATGTKDAENGRFEVTGLAKEFLSKADVTRSITFSEPLAKVPDTRAKPADLKVSTR